MKAKISKTLINGLQPGKKVIYVWDTDLSRFGLKVTPKNRRVYVVQYWTKGRRRWLTIGTCPPLSPDEARTIAGQRLRDLAAGEDPAEAAANEKHGATVSDLAKRYLDEHAATKKKERSAEEDKRLITKIINPRLGNRTLASVTRDDVGTLHHKMRETPYQANRVLALLRKMFNLAEGWGLRALNTNPCTHIEKFKEEKRRRFLSVDELARLGAALVDAEKENVEAPEALAAIRLLLFTGARVSEILTAKWEYYDADMGALVLPDSKSGFKSVTLSAPAREVVEGLPAIEGNEYLLPGRVKGTHLIGLEHIWYRIRDKAQLPDVRLHDLRHSYASVGAAANLGLPIIGALLGHLDPSTTARYSHLAQDPLKAAAELIGNKIDTAMKGKTKTLRRVK